MDEKREKQLKELQEELNIKFKNIHLLEQALTHSSYAHEVYHNEQHNEKLELLGDAVLSFIITEFLYKRYLTFDEGYLSHMKSYIISESILFKISQKMKLSKYLLLGKGEEKSGGRNKISLLSDTLEALIGAYYIDSGIIKTRDFVLRYFAPFINEAEENIESIKDWKSRFQEIAQKLFRLNPEYFVIKEEGPDHRKIFEIGVKVGDKVYGKGVGLNKKEAEKEAAKDAMRHF